jgi:hypothetical protein
MRRGFGLITAIMFIVLVATIGALALSFSSQTSKLSTDTYLKVQAELLSYSVTEYALLAISAHDRAATNDCVNRISGRDSTGVFGYTVKIRYMGVNLPAGCNILAGVIGFVSGIKTPESDVTVLIDTVVRSNSNTEPIRIHRRTLQKP